MHYVFVVGACGVALSVSLPPPSGLRSRRAPDTRALQKAPATPKVGAFLCHESERANPLIVGAGSKETFIAA